MELIKDLVEGIGVFFASLTNDTLFSITVSTFVAVALFLLANRSAKKREAAIDAKAQRALDDVSTVAELKTREHELRIEVELGYHTTSGVKRYFLMMRNFGEKPKSLIKADVLDEKGEVLGTAGSVRLQPHQKPQKLPITPIGESTIDGAAVHGLVLHLQPDGKIRRPLRLDQSRWPLVD